MTDALLEKMRANLNTVRLPRCKVCTSPYRETIALALAEGISYPVIAATLGAEVRWSIDPNTLKKHHRQHG
jgi:hypothetical protein